MGIGLFVAWAVAAFFALSGIVLFAGPSDEPATNCAIHRNIGVVLEPCTRPRAKRQATNRWNSHSVKRHTVGLSGVVTMLLALSLTLVAKAPAAAQAEDDVDHAEADRDAAYTWLVTTQPSLETVLAGTTESTVT